MRCHQENSMEVSIYPSISSISMNISNRFSEIFHKISIANSINLLPFFFPMDLVRIFEARPGSGGGHPPVVLAGLLEGGPGGGWFWWHNVGRKFLDHEFFHYFWNMMVFWCLGLWLIWVEDVSNLQFGFNTSLYTAWIWDGSSHLGHQSSIELLTWLAELTGNSAPTHITDHRENAMTKSPYEGFWCCCWSSCSMYIDSRFKFIQLFIGVFGGPTILSRIADSWRADFRIFWERCTIWQMSFSGSSVPYKNQPVENMFGCSIPFKQVELLPFGYRSSES